MLATLAAGSVLSVRTPLALSVVARAPLLRCTVRCCASESELSALTVVKLKEKLRAAGLPVTGTKAVLVARLLKPPPPKPPKPPPKPRAAPRAPAAPRVVIPRDPTPAAAASSSSSLLRVGTWNVAGLRGALGREAARASLLELGRMCDVLLLQETKLQTIHVADAEPALLEALGADAGAWRAAWACSTARKGYSGVCTLWRGAADASCAPLAVHPGHEADDEGRTLLLDLPLAGRAPLRIVNVYTPNSGERLQRLDFRAGADGWDARFRAAVALEGVVVGGDLNVAVGDLDFFNPDEARMEKQAGTTPEERASMRTTLGGLRDAFRLRHPAARGAFSYWSQRARNRPFNRGLRLDYFLVEPALEPAVADVQIRDDLEGSDHCPVVLTLDTAA